MKSSDDPKEQQRERETKEQEERNKRETQQRIEADTAREVAKIKLLKITTDLG